VKHVRLDKLLVELGLESSRERARERIEAGDVLVGGIVVNRPAAMVDPGVSVTLAGTPLRFVSRGGLKLEQALEAFGIACEGRVAIDVGASTGGFTDCLLQRGAARVYAVDVGYGQLAWKLRVDPRVVVIERQNIREMPRGLVPEEASIAVVDCSFIGLSKVLAPTAAFLAPGADIVALVKPQFEVGRAKLGKGGVVRDSKARADSIDTAREAAIGLGYEAVGGVDCATPGPMGNVEYLLWLRWSGSAGKSPSD
jgi:23S rRNA (cytidine1920-2'-O)/16S rRNA (cytidine1409-2'-O)-methyltransferase